MALTSLMLTALLPYAPAVEPAPTSPAPPEEVIDGKWHGFVELGGTYTDGNTDIKSARLAAEAIQRLTDDRYTLRAYWNYVQNDGDITDRNAGLNGKWDHFVSEKLYFNAVAGVETDSLAKLDTRWYVGGGAGYQFREDEKMKLNGEAGLVYFREEFLNNDSNDYIAARVAYDLDYTVSETTLFEQTTEVFPSVEDVEDFYGKVDSKLSFQIKANWSAFIQHILDYDNTPAGGAERLDNRVNVGLRWSF